MKLKDKIAEFFLQTFLKCIPCINFSKLKKSKKSKKTKNEKSNNSAVTIVYDIESNEPIENSEIQLNIIKDELKSENPMIDDFVMIDI